MSPEGQLTPAERATMHPAPERAAAATVFSIIGVLSFSHFLNDMIQSLIPALYPMLKASLSLSFAQVGLITLAFQMTASILQPVVGMYTDRRPMFYSLAAGMGLTLIGLLLLSRAQSFPAVLVSAALIGIGSSIFHPESSRMARAAAGHRHGFAQSMFQVGGNAGSAIGPLLAAFVVLPHGQTSIAWFSAFALLAMVLLVNVGTWYRTHGLTRAAHAHAVHTRHSLSRERVAFIIAILFALLFSKNFYIVSLSNYYTFYLIEKFHLTVQTAQVYLFVFLLAVTVGTFIGGPIGDKIGRKRVIWGSIVGALPFTLALPYVDLFWTVGLTIAIGLVIASAFAAIVVYAQELVPGRVGMIAGVFFGVSFGVAALGAAVLGKLADMTSLRFVYEVCAYLPAIGFLTALLPNLGVPADEKS
jgi:FSR family fosmidomycin resistance protein-like MFS transporter